MAGPETAKARRAALLLHGLSAGSRRRVLAKLAPAEADRVKPILHELRRLGVSGAVGRQLEQLSSFPNAPLSSGRRDSTVPERVASLAAADVLRCLERCAPATVAQLLRAGGWPWKQQVIDLMSEPRRTDVLGHLRRESAPLSPAFLEGLCERLCAEAVRSSNDHGAASVPHTRGSFSVRGPHASGTGQRLRRWLRWIR